MNSDDKVATVAMSLLALVACIGIFFGAVCCNNNLDAGRAAEAGRAETRRVWVEHCVTPEMADRLTSPNVP